MRNDIDDKLTGGRVRHGPMASDDRYGLTGAFFVLSPIDRKRMKIVASEASPENVWEHVSVSRQRRCPNWPEMCFVKSLFWGPEEEVVQFHPRKSNYVNLHPFCLHMWRNVNGHDLPPSIFVGPQSNAD